MLKSPLEIMREVYQPDRWLTWVGNVPGCKHCQGSMTYEGTYWDNQIKADCSYGTVVHTPDCLLRHIRVHLMREAIHGL